jgi:hypothetical protein
MKKAFYIIFILATGIVMSCGKSFLDQKPYTSVPVDEAIKTADEMGAAMNGTYTSMRGSNIYGRNIPVFGDLMADNVYVSVLNSGRYLVQNSYSTIPTTAEPFDMWRGFNSNPASASFNTNGLYGVIKNANVIINSPLTGTPVIDQYRGEALTVRALSHFDLVRWFAKPYTVDPNAEGVPVITSYDQNAKPNRSKVSEVYNQVLTDLAQAYGLMTVSKSSAFITKYVAKGLQAKVYLYMGDWTKARDAALDVVNNSGYSIVSAANFAAYWKNPVPVTAKGETMFELSLDGATNNGTAALAYIYDQAGYGDLLATTGLYNLYSATDVRKGLIIPGTRSSVPALFVNKYANGNSTDKDDLKILRFSEVVLILAEAYYRLNDETNALLYLNMLAQKRDPSFTGFASTGAQLLEDIITERRKELAFEGDRFQDLQRLNRVINRGPEYPAAAQTIAVDNFRRIQPIPQPERDANPNISQNTGY